MEAMDLGSVPYRGILERLFGFTEPVALADGELAYACPFCDAQSPGGTPPHARDCTYWTALPLFAFPAAARLVRQATRAAA